MAGRQTPYPNCRLFYFHFFFFFFCLMPSKVYFVLKPGVVFDAMISNIVVHTALALPAWRIRLPCMLSVGLKRPWMCAQRVMPSPGHKPGSGFLWEIGSYPYYRCCPRERQCLIQLDTGAVSRVARTKLNMTPYCLMDTGFGFELSFLSPSLFAKWLQSPNYLNIYP